MPAVATATKDKVQAILTPLAEMVNILELDQLDQAHIEQWNQWLTRWSKRDPPQEEFPLQKPRPSRLRGLNTKKPHLMVIFLIALSTFLTGAISFDLLHTYIDTAVIAATGVFTGLSLVGSGLFSIGKQRPT